MPNEEKVFSENELDESGEPVAEAPVDKFYCAGFDRKTENGESYCTYRAPRQWLGRCPLEKGGCGRPYDCLPIKNPRTKEGKQRVTAASSRNAKPTPRIKSKIPELDEVTGGGFAVGGAYLICGGPGGGKSTLAKQFLDRCATENCQTLYAQSEQTLEQVQGEFARLGIANENIEILITQEVTDIVLAAEVTKPRVIVADSINFFAMMNVDANCNSPSQLKSCSHFLKKFIQEKNIVLVWINHQSKAGELTIPREVEHDLDCTIFLDKYGSYKDGSPTSNDYTEEQKADPITTVLRVLQSDKNRHGAALKAVLEMTGKGLVTPKKVSKIVPIGEGKRFSGLEYVKRGRKEEED